MSHAPPTGPATRPDARRAAPSPRAPLGDVTARLATGSRAPSVAVTRPRLLLGGTGALAAVAAVAGGDLGGTAVRALAVVALLGVAAAAVLGRRTPTAGSVALRVRERQPLGRDSGVALVDAGDRRFLLGYGPAGVALLAAVDSAGEGAP